MLSGPLAECPHCGAAASIGDGLCLGCLLQAGSAGESANPDSLAAALDEIAVPHTHWRLGNYEVLEEIGRGGMGVIYRARQRYSRRIVALKRILSYHADSRETLARFRREAEAAASLDHPHILPIYEVGESEDGVPYFSMKFAPGGSLQEVGPALRQDPREIVRLMVKVTRAVEYAHGQGILHRDLKPGNILLDGRGEPLVSDFGLAKWLDASSNLTRTLTIFGTPGYIAPEQAAGPAIGLKPSADIYSLGAILFGLLANRPPFLGEHALAVIHQAAEHSAPRLRSLVKGADRDLETICARCLEREPEARYRSAGELAGDLESWLEGRSITARPVSPPSQLWRWSKRNPPLALSGLACFVLGAAALLWLTQGRSLRSSLRQGEILAHSVTVLPFLDLDTATADESTALALAQDLQTGLSRFGPVRIRALTYGGSPWAGTGSIVDIIEANKDHKARAVLTGSKRIVNGKTRLSIRLMNAATGDMLMTRCRELPSGDKSLATFEAAIKPALCSLLDASDWSTATSSARDPGMRSPAARDFIISGRQLMFRDTIEDFDRSIRCLEKAIQLEPKSALAHAYLSSTQASRTHFIPDNQLLTKADAEANEALRLDPDSPEAHRTLAGVLYQRGQFVQALEEQLRAIEVGGPEERVASFRGMTLLQIGQPERALGWLEMADHWALLPGSYQALIGDCWALLAQDEEAETAYRHSMDLRPETQDGLVGLSHLRLLQGRIEEAESLLPPRLAHAQERDSIANDHSLEEMHALIAVSTHKDKEAEQLYAQLAGSQSAGGASSYGSMSYASCLGRLRQLLGDTTGAQTILRDCLAKELAGPSHINDPAALYRIAAIEASLGRESAALERLQTAAATGWIDYRSLQHDLRFDSIAQGPRFQRIIADLKTKVAGLRQATRRRTSPLTGKKTPDE